MQYVAFVHKEPTSDYGVSFPDFPGCISAGRTLDAAYKNAGEALSLHIAGMREDGVKIPKPSKLDDLGRPKDVEAVFVIGVTTDKTLRVNITAPESQIKRIDAAATKAGMNRSAYLVSAALRLAR